MEDLEEKRKRVRERLVEVGDMRQGSLIERYVKCGKVNCRCAKEKAYGHGPSFTVTKAIKGKTITRVIPKQAVELTKAQIAQFREFRRLSQEFLEVNEEICDAKLKKPRSEIDNVQKKSSRRSLRPRLSEKSKNS